MEDYGVTANLLASWDLIQCDLALSWKITTLITWKSSEVHLVTIIRLSAVTSTSSLIQAPRQSSGATGVTAARMSKSKSRVARRSGMRQVFTASRSAPLLLQRA